MVIWKVGMNIKKNQSAIGNLWQNPGTPTSSDNNRSKMLVYFASLVPACDLSVLQQKKAFSRDSLISWLVFLNSDSFQVCTRYAESNLWKLKKIQWDCFYK